MPFTKTPPNHSGQQPGDAPPPDPGSSCIFTIFFLGLGIAAICLISYCLYLAWPLIEAAINRPA
ncbi:MAG TPA: hypothetical protein DCR55_01745 [Lentisphaeria bacterium]|jgi:hypothetical protein|nr:hypothetical protein [Lentisphaeria bacterium]